jgi:hypothetical protein
MTLTSVVFLFPATMHVNASDMNYTVVVLGGGFILSLVWYYLPVYGGVHWFEGPRPTVGGHVTRGWAAPRDVERVVHTFKPEKEGSDI